MNMSDQMMHIGMKRGTVYLIAHRAEWEEIAQRAVEDIKRVLRDVVVDAQHIGSTSIKTIPAKPIIDIAVGVTDYDAVLEQKERLAAEHITLRIDERPEQLLFVMGDFEQDTRTHHIHVVRYGSKEWNNYLNFRDYLNAHESAAQRYGALKKELSQRYPDDRAAYTEGKSGLIAELLSEASKWRSSTVSGLIINGDDYGMNKRCSAAIAQAFAEGRITSATMMANGAYFEEAVAMAKERGFADKIGVHFNLTEGAPLTEDIRSLSDFVSGGRFHKQYLNNPRPLSGEEKEAIRRELAAQAERLRQAGIGITHADSHHYIHHGSEIAPLVAQVCQAYGIGRVRLSRTFGAAERAHTVPNSWWRERGFVTTRHFGRLSDVVGIEIPDGTEIMVHPDFDRSGVLIDRVGVADGYPYGEALPCLL